MPPETARPKKRRIFWIFLVILAAILAAGFTFFLKRNPGGRFACASLIPTIETVPHEKYNGDLVISATQFLFALKRFKIERRDLPQSLEELVPSYIDTVPTDPFDGKPIRYSREKKILYPVGEDLVDAGGSRAGASRSLLDTKEPTLRIEF